MKITDIERIPHATRLDIALPQLHKHLSVKGTIDQIKLALFFAEQPQLVEKFDGLKVTIWRNSEPYDPTDYTKNWVFAYKNFVMFPEEFKDGDNYGYFQFHHVLDHIKSVHYKCQHIPCNTEFFVEFITNKPTLRTKYSKFNVIILLGWSESTGSVTGGYLHTSPTHYDSDATPFTNILELDLPPVVDIPINGTSVDDYEEWLSALRSHHSILGGQMEGVVVNGKFKIPFMVRQRSTAQFPEDKHLRAAYWDGVYLQVANNIPTGGSLVDRLMLWKEHVDHGIFVDNTKRNDMYVTGRKHILQSLDANQNALIVGRFQPLSKAHAQMIADAAAEFPTVFVAVVDGSLTRRKLGTNPFSYEARKEFIDELNLPNVVVVRAATGNVIAILNNLASGVATLIAGPDRAKTYSTQNVIDVRIVDYDRDGVSSSAIRKALVDNDYDRFKELSPPHMHGKFGGMTNGR